VDHGVSGAKEGRPELNRLLRDAKKRQIDIVVCWRLDRLGRSLRHLIFLLEELNALGVGFVSLGEGSTQARLPGGCSFTCSGPLRSSSAAACASASWRDWLGHVATGSDWDDHPVWSPPVI
jgi:resolvase-like protein